MPPWNRKKKVGGAQKKRISRMDPAMTIFREAAGSSLFEGPTPISFSLSFSLLFSISPFLSRSLLYIPRFASPSFFYLALFLRAKVPPPCLRLPWRHSSEDEEGPTKTSYLTSFIRVLLDGHCTLRRSFFLDFFQWTLYCNFIQCFHSI